MIYKTIGVGGNYADIGAAWAYLVSLIELIDDYTFTIISDFIEVTGGVSVSRDVNWAQKTISFLNPNGYWITHITNDGYTFMSRAPGNNINDRLIVDGLRIKYLGLLTGINVDVICAIYENNTDVTDSSGRPPHSIEVVVSGGTDQDIADFIWSVKPAGIQTYGSSSATVSDSNGDSQTIYFSRPTYKYVHLEVTIDSYYAEEQFPLDGVDQIKAAIFDYAEDFSLALLSAQHIFLLLL